MTLDTIMRIASEALILVLLLSALPVLAAVAVGLTVSIIQAATQIQEQTLSVVPKIVAVYVVLLLGGGFMLREIVRFSVSLFRAIGQL
ncbi:MAG: flagellar type III secretion system protein FliQ [Phycisphaerales bacterium]|nr:flagellar type III secretion system protein FliQ [Phycisphaerales bacterium]